MALNDEMVDAVVAFIEEHLGDYIDADCDSEGCRELFDQEGLVEAIVTQFNLVTEEQLDLVDQLIEEVRWEQARASAYSCGVVL